MESFKTLSTVFTAIHFIVVIQIKSIISMNNSDGIADKSR